MDFHDVCQFLKDRSDDGERCVLVTVCAVEGSSMRNPGTIMGVAEDGSFSGSLSGGCIENAVVSEALDVLKTGATRVVRFGAGSPYLDIRLPCGGGLDLHFCPLVNADFVDACLASLRKREAFAIGVGPQGASHVSDWCPNVFNRQSASGFFGQWPAPKLGIIGHGAGVEALTHLAVTLGCWTHVLTPDDSIIEALDDHLIGAERLERRTQSDLLKSDPWTAFVFLFHDHDWETELMERALELPHFYIGAMGGRKAHAARCEALAERGVAQSLIDTIRAPIGLFHSSRDPQTLALSTLAEVIRSYQDADFEAALG